jgi:hypothetical protein
VGQAIAPLCGGAGASACQQPRSPQL